MKTDVRITTVPSNPAGGKVSLTAGTNSIGGSATHTAEANNGYRWGETMPAGKNENKWKYYKYCDNQTQEFSKYISTDNLPNLESIDDAATQLWGSEWNVPTKEQWEELVAHTNRSELKNADDERIGFRYTKKDDSSIYIDLYSFGKNPRKDENPEAWYDWAYYCSASHPTEMVYDDNHNQRFNDDELDRKAFLFRS